LGHPIDVALRHAGLQQLGGRHAVGVEPVDLGLRAVGFPTCRQYKRTAAARIAGTFVFAVALLCNRLHVCGVVLLCNRLHVCGVALLCGRLHVCYAPRVAVLRHPINVALRHAGLQ
jgi:hypothetical protein